MDHCVEQFFRPKTISKVAIIKTKSPLNHRFFSPPPFLLLSFFFVAMFLELLGLRNLPFDAFFFSLK